MESFAAIYSAAWRGAGAQAAVEVARQQAQHLGRGVGEHLAVAGDAAREHVVDDHGGNGGDEAGGGGEQRLGDAGRHHGEVGRVGLRDADEGVHDAPDRAEQADEGRGGADGGEQPGAAAHRAAGARLDAAEQRGGPLLDALGAEALRALASSSAAATRRPTAVSPLAIREAASPSVGARASSPSWPWARRRAAVSSIALASSSVQVTSEAKARPIMTAFTTMSAFMNMPKGDRSCGISADPVPAVALVPGAASGETAVAAGAMEPGAGIAGVVAVAGLPAGADVVAVGDVATPGAVVCA